MAVIENPATGLPVGDPDRIPLDPKLLPDSGSIRKAAAGMILSASGWRKVFAAYSPGDERASWVSPLSEPDAARETDENSLGTKVPPADLILAGAMARTFGEFILARAGAAAGRAAGPIAAGRVAPAILLGIDSRPTGPALADIFARTLTAMGIRVRYLFIVAAPEIMAYAGYAASLGTDHPERAEGFAYISASHNPPGHNGVKFGALSGGVLPGSAITPLIARFRELVVEPDPAASMYALIASAEKADLRRIFSETTKWKRLSLSAYTLFSHRVVTGRESLEQQEEFLDELAMSCMEHPLGIVADLNGSARCLSIDRDWLEGLNLHTLFLNDRVRSFAHRIVPEGESLDFCRRELEKAHKNDPSFELGYSPDCDGDRGNLVWFDRASGAAHILEAQEVFALCCISELACLVRDGKTSRVAIAVNDGTSMRIEEIASRFGATVFRAETGEANVVGLADRLRTEGWTVRILGEGSNGGNITHPAMVRDPLATLGAMVKLLRLRDGPGGEGLFRIWLRLSGSHEAYRPDFDLGDVIASLPQWISTSVFEQRAALHILSADKIALKERYRSIFLSSWEGRKSELARRFGVTGWKAYASNGSSEREVGEDFASSGSGGLRIVLTRADGSPAAFLWMRGSGTEPVFRVMADAAGGKPEDEEYLLAWHVGIVREADAATS